MKLTLEAINYINVFEKISRVIVKDCIVDKDGLMFIVDEDFVPKAVGKNGFNVKKANTLLKKNIQIVGYSPDICKFIPNLVRPYSVDVKLENKIVFIDVKENSVKGKILGRDRNKLKYITSIAKRYFDIDCIKVR